MITPSDIVASLQPQVTQEAYGQKPSIEGVRVIDLASYPGEQGDFSELVRLTPEGELQNAPGFKLAQVNRAHLLPGSIKAWHFHYLQDELWYVDPRHSLVLGLWDIRQNSPTSGVHYKIVLGAGRSRLVHIPAGVAHGSFAHTSQELDLYYFVNRQFDPNQADEQRLPWDSVGAEFWTMEKG